MTENLFNFSSLPLLLGFMAYSLPPFSDEGTEAKRDYVICPMPLTSIRI